MILGQNRASDLTPRAQAWTSKKSPYPALGMACGGLTRRDEAVGPVSAASMESDVKGRPPRYARRSWHRTSRCCSSGVGYGFSVAGIAGRRAPLVVKRCRFSVLRLNQASIWALRAISSFGSVRGHSLMVGPPERSAVGSGTGFGGQPRFGYSPSNLKTSEIVPSDRRARESRETSAPSSARRSGDQLLGLYLSFFFHMASTAAASLRAMVSRARLGRVPFSRSWT